MSSVDERIVKMTFENEKFEAGVKKTLETLEALKEKLNFKTHDKAFKGIETSLNNANFSGMESGIEALNKRFSTLGIVGMEVTRRLTNAVIDAGKKLGSITFGQIKQGGMNRALNIEQARFQLQGLLKDADKVEAAMTAAGNAVDGTAYGLDEAAKAASVLAASGITESTRLEAVLTSIAGAAAMTGRQYSDIADIYSTVASNGKLMTMQLRQFSASGLNVSAVLAKAFNTTEENINEMTRKGEISFDMFSDAMMEFGEHAKEANNTYTGAMANMKSALSRIGELFATPYIDNMKYVFNAARNGLNEVKYALVPFADLVREKMVVVREAVVKGLEALTGGFVDGKYQFSAIGKLVQGITNIVKALGNAIKPIGSAFKAMFPKATLNNLSMVIDRFNKWSEALLKMSANTRQVKNMEYAYKGLFAVLKLAGTIFSTLVQGVNRLLKPFGGLLNILNFIIGVVGRVVYGIVTLITKVRIVCRVFTLVTTIIGGVFQILVNLVKAIGKAINAVRNSKPVVAAIDAISTAFHACAAFIGAFIDKIKDLGKRIASFVGSGVSKVISEFANILTVGLTLGAEAITKVVGKLKELFKTVKKSRAFVAFSDAIANARTYLGQFIDKIKEFGKAISDFVREHRLVERFFEALSAGLAACVGVLVLVATKIRDFAKSIYEFAKETGLLEAFMEMFHKGLDKLKEGLEKVVEYAKKFGEWLSSKLKTAMSETADTAKESGKKISESFDFKGIQNGIETLIEAFKILKKWLTIGAGGLGKFAEYLGKGLYPIFDMFKTKIEDFITAFKNANWDQILDVIHRGIFDLFVLSLARFLNGIGGTAKSLKGVFNSLSGTIASFNKQKAFEGPKWHKRVAYIISFAGAIFILAKAVQMLGKLDIGEFGRGLGAVAGLMIAMSVSIGLLARALNKFDKVNLAQVGIGMIGLAGSVLLLSKAVSAFGKMKVKSMIKGFAGVAAALTVLTIAVKYGLGQADHMFSTALGLTVLSVALLAFLKVIQIYNTFDWGILNGDGLFMLSAALVALVASAKLIGNQQHMMAAGAGMIMMAAALLVLKKVVEEFSEIGLEGLGPGLLGMVVGLGMLSVSLYMLDGIDTTKSSKSLFRLVAALSVLTLLVKVIGAMNPKAAMVGFIGLAGALAMMSGALYLLSGKNDLMKTAASIVIVAAALGIIAGAVRLMGELPFDTLIASLVGFAGMIAIMTFALIALGSTNGSTLKSAASLVVMSAAILVLAGALTVISAIPMEKLKTGLIGLGIALALVVAVGAIGGIGIVTVGLIALSVALVALGACVLLTGAGILLFVNALETLGEMGPESMQRVVDAIIVFIQGLAEAIPLIMASAIKIGLAFIAGLTTLIPAITTLGLQMIVSLLAGIAANIGDIVQMATLVIVQFLTGLANSLPLLIQAGIALMVNFVNGLADGIRTAAPLLVAAAKNMMSAVLEAILSMMQEYLKDIPVIGDKINAGLEKAKNKLQEAFDVEGTKKRSKELLKSVEDAASEGTQPILDKCENLKNGIKEKLLGMGGDASAGGQDILSKFLGPIQGGTGEAASASDQLGLAGVSGLDNPELQALAQQYGIEIPTDYASSILGGQGQVSGAGASLANILGLQLNTGTDKASAAGSAASNAYSSSANSVKPSISGFLGLVVKAFGGENTKYKSEGEKSGKSYADGLGGSSPKRKAADAGRAVSQSGNTAAGNVSWSGAGTQCVNGFAGGISANAFKAKAAAAAMARAAKQAAEAALGVASPSKEFIKIGKYVDEGFVLGIKRFQNRVYKASSNMGESAINAVSDPMKKVYEILTTDFDMNPVITPVLDLSDISNGVSQMNRMLDTGAISTRVGYGISAMAGAAQAVSSITTDNSTQSYNINVYGTPGQDVNQLADAVVDRIIDVNSRKASMMA